MLMLLSSSLRLKGPGAAEGGVDASPHLHSGNVEHHRRARHGGVERHPPQNRDDVQPVGPRLPRPKLPGQCSVWAGLSGRDRGLPQTSGRRQRQRQQQLGHSSQLHTLPLAAESTLQSPPDIQVDLVHPLFVSQFMSASERRGKWAGRTCGSVEELCYIPAHHVFQEINSETLSLVLILEIVLLFYFCFIFHQEPHLCPRVQLPRDGQLSPGMKISLSTLVLTVHLADEMVKGR